MMKKMLVAVAVMAVSVCALAADSFVWKLYSGRRFKDNYGNNYSGKAYMVKFGTGSTMDAGIAPTANLMESAFVSEGGLDLEDLPTRVEGAKEQLKVVCVAVIKDGCFDGCESGGTFGAGSTVEQNHVIVHSDPGSNDCPQWYRCYFFMPTRTAGYSADDGWLDMYRGYSTQCPGYVYDSTYQLPYFNMPYSFEYRETADTQSKTPFWHYAYVGPGRLASGVKVVPATVANATAKVYTNGIEVTGSPIRVLKDAAVKIVYTAADGYAFDITGKTVFTNELTAAVNPLVDTTTEKAFLMVVKYETLNSTEKKYVTYYMPSLKAAVEKAVADGDTEFYPELLANSEGDGIYIPEGAFSDGYVFEFGGYSYTITNAVKATGTSGTDGFYLGSSGGFRGPGTISCTADSGVKTLVNNRGDLSLGGLTLDGTNMHKTGEKCIVLSNSCTDQGSATLDEVNLIAAEGDVALDTCTVGGASAPFVTLLFANGTVINGDIELKGGNVEIRGENAGTATLVDAGIGDGIIRRWNSTIAAPTAYYWAPGEVPWEILKKLYEVKPATADGLTVKVYTNGAEVAGPRYFVLPNSLVTDVYATTNTYYFTNGTRTVTTELTVTTDPMQDTVMDVWDAGWHCVDDYEGDDTEKIYQAAIADGFSENIATRLSRSGVKGYAHFCKWANVGVKGQQYSTENLRNATNLLFKAAYQQPWDRNLADLDDNPWYQQPWFQGAEILFKSHYDKEIKDWIIDFTYFWTTNYVDEAYGATGKETCLYGFWKLYGSMTLVDENTTSDELFRESIGCLSSTTADGVMTETSGVARVISADAWHDQFEVIFIPKWDPKKEEPPKTFLATPIFY